MNYCTLGGRPHFIGFGFTSLEFVEKSELPAVLRAAIDAIGLVHPLIYQNRPTL